MVNILYDNELTDAVEAEARALRNHATQDEIDMLDFDELDPLDPDQCIYGQMTGNCYSDRAKELIELCCNRVYKSFHGSLPNIGAPLNGSPIGKSRMCDDEELHSNTEYYSPIELYISGKDEERIAKLIRFIQGEVDSPF